MKQKLIIGTRSSELALWQANFVKREIEKKNKNVSVELKLIKTKGDKILNVALAKIGDKGLFTKELEAALLNNEIDIAVHSLKDLQTEIPPQLKLAAISKRHNVEDVIIAKKKNVTLDNLKENAVVATGSLRRKAQILHIRPDIQIVELRGNVPTRISKFLSSNWDAIILARAGVERLKLNKHISSIIPRDVILPAVGQGALGIEINAHNKFADEIIQTIHDEKTFFEISAERAFLKTLEGGCQVPIAAFGQLKSNGLYFEGLVASIDGSLLIRSKMKGKKIDAEKIGIQLAKTLLKAGAKNILKEIYNK